MIDLFAMLVGYAVMGVGAGALFAYVLVEWGSKAKRYDSESLKARGARLAAARKETDHD